MRPRRECLSALPFIVPGVWPVLIGAWTALAGAPMVWRTNLIVSLLPVLLSLDNFLFGAALGPPSGIVDAAVSGMVSAALAAAGLLSGGMIAWVRGRRDWPGSDFCLPQALRQWRDNRVAEWVANLVGRALDSHPATLTVFAMATWLLLFGTLLPGGCHYHYHYRKGRGGSPPK